MKIMMEKFTSPHISMRYNLTMNSFVPDKFSDRAILRELKINCVWKETKMDDLLAIVNKEGYWLETIDTREDE